MDQANQTTRTGKARKTNKGKQRRRAGCQGRRWYKGGGGGGGVWRINFEDEKGKTRKIMRKCMKRRK